MLVLAAATAVAPELWMRGWGKHVTSGRILGDVSFLIPSCHSEGCLPGSEAISHHRLQPWCSTQETIRLWAEPSETGVVKRHSSLSCFCQVGRAW